MILASMKITLKLFQAISKSSPEIHKKSYTFTQRISEATLISSMASKIVTAEQHFRMEINSAVELYRNNFVNILKMDQLFGIVDYQNPDPDEDLGMGKMKDGTLRLSCPVSGCKTRTFKLKRHMQSQHEDLGECEVLYAVKMALKFERNKRLTQGE